MSSPIQYCIIPLTQGKSTKVSEERYDALNERKWYAMRDNDGAFYAVRNQYIGKGRSRLVYMARELMGLQPSDRRIADHINGDFRPKCNQQRHEEHEHKRLQRRYQARMR